jgi:hypothetical protein
MPKKNDTSPIPLPHIDGETPKFVAFIHYQIPGRILLQGRRKTSPRFETMYGMLYWLNKQPYHMDFTIFRTDKGLKIRSGSKKAGEIIK